MKQHSHSFHAVFGLLAFGLTAIFHPATAKDVFVDAKAGNSGSGSEQSPFKTITEAVNALDKVGGTATIKGGVYRENVTIAKGGVENSPLVLRAAAGERVCITGCDPVTGWKMEGKLATLISKEPIYDLFVHEQRQRCSRFPDIQSPWTKVTAAGAGNEVQVEAVPKLSAGQEKGLCASLFTKSSENFCGLLANFNAAAKSFPFSVGSWTKVNVDDPVLFYNAIDLIKNPGEWACQPLDDGTYKVAYLPRNAQELEQTQTHVRDTVVTIGILGRDICRNVRLEGLEIAGGSSMGIRANHVENLTISRCVVYNSGNAATVNGAGIFCDNCNHARVESCIIFANMHGIGMTQGDGNVITGCEVAFNDNDGIDITGRKTMPEAPQTNATIDHNYFHHHIYLGHADNSQIWGNLEGFYFNHNLSIIGGQNLMTEECKKLRCSDSVMISAGARHVILGHENAFDAHFKNMIFMFGNFGSIGFSSNTTGVEVFDNVFYESKMIYGGVDPKGGRNLHFMPSETNVLTCKVGDKVNSYKSPAELHAANGLEADSKVADPQFKNAPSAQFISTAPTKSTPNTLYFDPKRNGDAYPVMFAKVTTGDTVEVNGDGVPRKVQSKGADFIVIDPPLPTAPHREVFVWYWGKKTDIKLDLSSPICNGKGQPGTSLNIAAYQRGELDGSGKRSLPELSEEARTAWPDPCNYIYPCRIPPFNQVQAKGK